MFNTFPTYGGSSHPCYRVVETNCARQVRGRGSRNSGAHYGHGPESRDTRFFTRDPLPRWCRHKVLVSRVSMYTRVYTNKLYRMYPTLPVLGRVHARLLSNMGRILQRAAAAAAVHLRDAHCRYAPVPSRQRWLADGSVAEGGVDVT